MESYPQAIENARWIWTDDDPSKQNVWIWVRRCFEAKSGQNAQIHLTADQRYRLWCNGLMLGFGPPKFDMRFPTLDTYDLSEHLCNGQNVIAVLVYSCGDLPDISSIMPLRGGLLGAIELDDQLIVTDSSWSACRERAYTDAAILRGDVQGHNEVFDARLMLSGASEKDYDHGHWPAAVELTHGPLAEPYEAIVPRDIDPVCWTLHRANCLAQCGTAKYDPAADVNAIDDVARQLAQAQRYSNPNGDAEANYDPASDTLTLTADAEQHRGTYGIWDFGRIVTGYPVIELAGTAGAVVDISYAEHLTDGRVDQLKPGIPHYFDRIILDDKPLRHRITWAKCLQFLQIDLRSGHAAVRFVGMEVSSYPVQRKGCFYSNDLVLDTAWKLGEHTLSLCMDDNFMDTPWRERGSWLGDTIPQTRANYRTFGDTKLVRRFLLLHALGQNPDGSLCGKYPAKRTSHVHTWSLTFPIILGDYIRYSGDEELAATLWPVCERIIDWLESYRTDEGLYGNLPLNVTAEDNVYTFIDWAPSYTKGTNAAFNAYACAFYQNLITIAQMAGRTDDAVRCGKLLEGLTDNFRRKFWDESRGVFVNGRENGRLLRRWGCQENYLALVFGLASVAQRDRIVQRLRDEDLLSYFTACDDDYDEPLWSMPIALSTYRWDDEKMVPLGTPFFAAWALWALFEGGMGLEALEMIRKHWGNYARCGASTTWELWDRQGSLSHGWGAGPVTVMSRYILGVDQGDDALKQLEILPQRIDLTKAGGRVPMRDGTVDVAWQFNTDTGWTLEVTIPEGYSAMVGLPAEDVTTLRRNGKAVASPVPCSRGAVNFLAVLCPTGTWRITG